MTSCPHNTPQLRLQRTPQRNTLLNREISAKAKHERQTTQWYTSSQLTDPLRRVHFSSICLHHLHRVGQCQRVTRDPITASFKFSRHLYCTIFYLWYYPNSSRLPAVRPVWRLRFEYKKLTAVNTLNAKKNQVSKVVKRQGFILASRWPFGLPCNNSSDAIYAKHANASQSTQCQNTQTNAACPRR